MVEQLKVNQFKVIKEISMYKTKLKLRKRNMNYLLITYLATLYKHIIPSIDFSLLLRNNNLILLQSMRQKTHNHFFGAYE